ncbi:MAG: type I restriction-modification system subunit M [Candidatus Omnitrophica bacterium]|nr:type I restriction-modification system subunit M [Candidatus Omnitrophota bacterium]
MTIDFKESANFIWSIADLLRGDYKQSEYGKVILPLTVLRRLDCVLEPTKQKVLNYLSKSKGLSPAGLEAVLKRQAKLSFYNKSKFDFQKLVADPNDISANLKNYINGFSKNARTILERFNFNDHIERLDKSNLIYKVIKRFAEIDLHPDKILNIEMGYIFEELIRKFADLSNETAGEHFTSREVIRLMVNILFLNDKEILTKKGILKTLYDPACGTGGMLSVAEEYLRELNPDADLRVFGQELNDESYAICNSDMLIKGQNTDNIKRGNSFTQDGLKDEKFDYMLSNPPFGVEWKKVETEIKKESETQGFTGRFGAGLPRISDGSFLFLQHMISKMRPENGGARLGIVFNGSPLFSGGAGSGESEIRRWIIENDMLEAIIALPDQLFYNTGIATYIWIVTNRKDKKREGKIQFVNAVGFFQKMSRSLGNKRHEIKDNQIEEITQIYGKFKQGELCKIFDNSHFGYTRVTVERPLRLNFQASKERIARLDDEAFFKNLAKSKKKGDRALKEIEEGEEYQKFIKSNLSKMDSKKLYKNRDEFINDLKKIFDKKGDKIKAPIIKMILKVLSERDETADICMDAKGNPEPDPDLRDCENVPLNDNVEEYFKKEVLPHVPDAWMDRSKDKIGYEINFTKEFYKYKPLRSLEDIRKDILALEKETEGLMSEVLES